jgi:hypothetical protein
MPNGNTVRPQKWSNVIDLYDDGDYSAIWGNYDGSPTQQLGVRWNGSGAEVGYPNQGANPTWYVEPDDLAGMILLNFYSKVKKNPSAGNLQNILKALQECL